MINFMVLGGQRSGTTWLANLLTTDTTLCLHDPLLEYTPNQLDRSVVPGYRLGISCTASLLFNEWVQKHPAKKVLIYRDPEEINASCRALGLLEIDVSKQFALLGNVEAPIFHWDHMFKPSGAEEICEILGVPFCKYRHFELRKMNIQPCWDKLDVSKEAVQNLARRIQEVL